MAIKKKCKNCGEAISLRKMPAGHWVAFDYNTNSAHKCVFTKASKQKAAIPQKTTACKESVPNLKTSDSGPYIDAYQEIMKTAEADNSYKNEHTDAILSLANLAIKEGNILSIYYHSNHSNTWASRDVCPIRIYEENGTRYLRAYCLLRKDERTFRIDRIKTAKISTIPAFNHLEEIKTEVEPETQQSHSTRDYSWVLWFVVIIGIITYLSTH